MNKKQIALIVLDGWGYRPDMKDNAIAEAHTPFFDSLWRDYPHTTLDASEENVGLPLGQIGNSEVGHMTIGAGRIIDTDLVRITKAMKAGEFVSNPALAGAFAHVKEHNSTLHIMGLVSPGGIHSHEEHLYGILDAAKTAGVKNVVIHAFTDGRDVPPRSAAQSLKKLEAKCIELGNAHIASVSGRIYAMDRDHNWDRTEKVKQALFSGAGTLCADKKPSEMMAEMYTKNIFDEHLEPVVFRDATGKTCLLENNDAVIVFNFRPDRVRQITKCVADVMGQMNIYLATLTEYEKTLNAHVAFAPAKVETTIAEEVSKAGLTQVHIAETEKYPHATYFLNGGKEEPHTGEEFVLVESRKDVLTHDLAPEMRAREIADAAIAKINTGTDFIFINFANADMVGHTANKPAIITAVETVDCELGRVIAVLKAQGGVAFITADHGNAEVNVDPETGERHTAHTLNVVPAILTEEGHTMHLGKLSDIAPTILTLLSLPIPAGMTGKTLF